jgi:hypothetical protein
VTIDSPCLDCGEPLRVEIRDGIIMNEQETTGYKTYVSVPFWKWFEDSSYA